MKNVWINRMTEQSEFSFWARHYSSPHLLVEGRGDGVPSLRVSWCSLIRQIRRCRRLGSEKLIWALRFVMCDGSNVSSLVPVIHRDWQR